MGKAIIFILFVTFASCASTAPTSSVYVLKYDDFGPPVIASRVIGMDWWQWQSHGDSRPKRYDIMVVVYRNIELEEVKKIYQVIPRENKDYRYLEYHDALKFLDEHIDENVIEKVTNQLVKTKVRIINFLGDK